MMKRLLVSAVNALGLTDRLASSEWRRERLLILCYHGISLHDEHEWSPELYMPPALFEQRLRHLRANNYNILPLGEALDRLRAGTLPPRSVSITSDDGAHDFAEAAVPLLAKYDAPATVYLTSHYARWRFPVFNVALHYLLWKGRDSGRDLAPLAESKTPLPVSTPAHRLRAWHVMHQRANEQGLTTPEKDEFLRRIADSLGVTDTTLWDRQLLHIMSEDELRALPDTIAVELHTHRHRTPATGTRSSRKSGRTASPSSTSARGRRFRVTSATPAETTPGTSSPGWTTSMSPVQPPACRG